MLKSVFDWYLGDEGVLIFVVVLREKGESVRVVGAYYNGIGFFGCVYIVDVLCEMYSNFCELVMYVNNIGIEGVMVLV